MSGACVAAKVSLNLCVHVSSTRPFPLPHTQSIKPSIKVIGVEPAAADDCAKSLAAGKLIPNPSLPNSICEALLMNLSENPWAVIRHMLNGVVTVTDEETVAAMRLVWERMKVVVESSAACTVAAVMKEEFRQLAGPGVEKVGVVLCGGNVDLDHLPWVTSNP